MRYDFPILTHADQVREAIAGREEIIEADRDDVIIFDYMVSMSDTFPNPALAPDAKTAELWAIRRECRGLIFDKATGKPIRRSWHKFFNAGEKEETALHMIDMTQPHVVLDKIDGSMVTPYRSSRGRYYWGTRMGYTDVAKQAEEFVMHDREYRRLCDQFLDQGKTPIFEWCSRKQRIVIDHPTDRLVLVGVRDIETGIYEPYEEIGRIATENAIPVVRAWASDSADIRSFVSRVKDEREIEGYVIRFSNGHMIKVKCDWYCRIHSAKDAIVFEKNVIAMILANALDDVVANLPESDQKRIRTFSDAITHGVMEYALDLGNAVKFHRDRFGDDRKAFALAIKDVPADRRGMMFSVWAGKAPIDVTMAHVMKNLHTATEVEKIRHMIGNHRWEAF